MPPSPVDRLAAALLYEGYFLYPYRPSALKNRRRWMFGVLYPQAFSAAQDGPDAWMMQTECLLRDTAGAALDVRIRFLHVLPSMNTGSEEAVEREVSVGSVAMTDLLAGPVRAPFAFDGIALRQRPINGDCEVSAHEITRGIFRVRVLVRNLTIINGAESVDHDAAMGSAMVSTHAILSVRGGEFVSLLESPDELKPAAASCRNIGTWPVLVGPAGERDQMLSSPIILYDYPQLAPESPGDFYDGTEIDEMLALRIRTLTEEEKQEVRVSDARVRAILDRAEGLAKEDLLALHGAVRQLETACIRPGDRVRLRPAGGADAFDLALHGRTATVASVDADFEGRTHLAVVVDDDPGRDLGLQGRPGHRFYFRPEEVELLRPARRAEP
jgi:hypothetical protein